MGQYGVMFWETHLLYRILKGPGLVIPLMFPKVNPNLPTNPQSSPVIQPL